MTLIERLKSLGKRREAEGIYTDQNICENAIEEIKRLNKYRSLVLFINEDYHELSYEKARWQRDDWKKRANKLIEEDQ